MSTLNVLDFLVVSKVCVADGACFFVSAIEFVLLIGYLAYLFLGHASSLTTTCLRSSPSNLSMQFVQVHDQSLVKFMSSSSFSAHLVNPPQDIIPSFLDAVYPLASRASWQ